MNLGCEINFGPPERRSLTFTYRLSIYTSTTVPVLSWLKEYQVIAEAATKHDPRSKAPVARDFPVHRKPIDTAERMLRHRGIYFSQLVRKAI